MIWQQRLKPGDRLPTEVELARQFGVSRVSVREATRALSFVGLLDAAPRRGLTVARLDMQRVSECLGFHLSCSEYPKVELLDTRILLETGALPLVMERMAGDRAIYTALENLNHQLRESSDAAARIELDIAFHRTLLEASGLSPLVAFHDLLQIFFQRFRESLLEGEWPRGIAGHQQLIEALRDGQLAEASATLREHLAYHQRYAESAG